jgi:hypothetical protein
MFSGIHHELSIYKCIFTNEAPELTPYNSNLIPTPTESQKILSLPSFEPGSLGQMSGALSNSANHTSQYKA